MHDNSGFGQNSTTLTSSFEDSQLTNKGRDSGLGDKSSASAFANNQARQEAMPYNKNFAKTDSAALH